MLGRLAIVHAQMRHRKVSYNIFEHYGYAYSYAITAYHFPLMMNTEWLVKKSFYDIIDKLK